MDDLRLAKDLGRTLSGTEGLAGLVFSALAYNGIVDDVTITEHPEQFQDWTPEFTGKAGTIVKHDGALYRLIKDFDVPYPQAVPSSDPSSWKQIGDPSEEWQDWSQPLGAHDAYLLGAKVRHDSKRWVSELDGNVWQPGVYGWKEVT